MLGSIWRPSLQLAPDSQLVTSRKLTQDSEYGDVSMLVNGREAELPPSSSPVGYEIDRHGRLTTLEEGERPECA